MKKILLVSEAFAPDNSIAAIRITKIGKYLAQAGYGVDVLRKGRSGREEDILLKNDLKHFNKIFINFNNIFFDFFLKTKRNILNNNYFNIENAKNARRIIKNIKLFNTIKNIFYYLLVDLKSINYYINASLRKDIQFKNYDFVFSSYGPLSSHLIGAFIKKKNKNIVWIADFRDPMIFIHVPAVINLYRSFFENFFFKNADIITLVSSGCCSAINSKTHIITNGYDKDDFSKIKKISSGNKFIFCYAGTMYNGYSKADIFFKILNELFENKIIESSEIEIQYLGRNAKCFIDQVPDYFSKDIIRNFGFVSREKSIEIQNKSNALLLLSWNYHNHRGAITGKIFEYLMAKKPVLCFVSGDIGNCEVKKIISDSESGFCYEEANSIIDYDLMKNYIKEQIINWKKWKTGGFIPKKEYVEQYDYKNIVQDLIKLLEK